MRVMGDAGEGLIDAEARLAELMDERAREGRRAAAPAKSHDPERLRRAESLRLARIELEGQQAATSPAVRKQQLAHAIAEIDRQLVGLANKGTTTV